MASNSLALDVSTGKDSERPSPSSLSHNSGRSPEHQASDLPQSDIRSTGNAAPKKQKSGKGKSKWKVRPLDQRKSMPWKSDHTVMNFLMSKLPQYQLLLEEKETQKKRQWLEDTEGEVVSHCPQDWVDHWGTDHLKKVRIVTILCTSYNSHSVYLVLPRLVQQQSERGVGQRIKEG